MPFLNAGHGHNIAMEQFPLQVNIHIDKESESPIYIQLYEQLKAYISDGTLSEDFRLPPIRSFAESLAVNSITVVNAYKLLENDNLVYKKAGSGTYVMPIKDKVKLDSDFSIAGDEMEYQLEAGMPENVINLATATPDPKLFPITDFKRVMNEVLERDGANAFIYQDSKGYEPLRASISRNIEKHGIKVSADDIYVISGAQQGIDIISKVMLTYGDYVFVESPTYTGALGVFKSRGAKIIDVPLQQDGPDMGELEKLLKLIRPKFFYTMPNFQNPTGCTYSERKKKHLMLLCRKYDIKIVEDDYLSDLNYLDTAALPLKSYDREDRVIYIKSFSKVFMPGLRVAYIVIPDDIREKVTSAKYMTDISTSGLMQRVLDKYLGSSIWNKHIEYMKREYSIRYLEAVRSARKYLRGASFNQPNGGLNLWIRLPEGVCSTDLYNACKERGVLITPGTTYLKDEEGERHIRISFAGVDPEKIPEGMSVIGQVMEGLKKK